MNSNKISFNDVVTIKSWNSTFPDGVLQKKIIAFFENCDRLGYSVDGYQIDLTIPGSDIVGDETNEDVLDMPARFEPNQDLPLFWYLEEDDENTPKFRPVLSTACQIDLQFALTVQRDNIVELIVNRTRFERTVTCIVSGNRITSHGTIQSILEDISSLLIEESARQQFSLFLNEHFQEINSVHSIALRTNDSFIPISIGIQPYYLTGDSMADHELNAIRDSVFKGNVEHEVIEPFIQQLKQFHEKHSGTQIIFDAKKTYFSIVSSTSNKALFAGRYESKRPMVRFRNTNIHVRNIPERFKRPYPQRTEGWTYVEIHSETIAVFQDLMEYEISRNP